MMRYLPPGVTRERGARSGLTLLEVLVSLAIFLFSLAALSQLLTMSGDRALEANLRTQANLMCQSKLAELAVGAVSMSSSGYEAFKENPDWQWRADCNESDVVGLWNVQVWVKKDRPGGVVEVSLSQMVLDPQRNAPATPDSSMPDLSGGTP